MKEGMGEEREGGREGGILGIISCSYGGQEAPQSVICKLENQEIQWYNSVRFQRPENQELLCQRAGEDGYPSSRRENLTFLWPFVPFGAPSNQMMPDHIAEDGSLHSAY